MNRAPRWCAHLGARASSITGDRSVLERSKCDKAACEAHRLRAMRPPDGGVESVSPGEQANEIHSRLAMSEARRYPLALPALQPWGQRYGPTGSKRSGDSTRNVTTPSTVTPQASVAETRSVLDPVGADAAPGKS